ncbi:MAG: hypothetical protein DME13_29560 [Candidatus Rokuibacteriota bacterium]|nr:MAG: hypothetical protein DME13_29560 [Candidatus Rokubacteria bacterium]
MCRRGPARRRSPWSIARSSPRGSRYRPRAAAARRTPAAHRSSTGLKSRYSRSRHGLIPRELATRLAAAAAFRNLVAHQYGALDWRRVYALASSELGDLDVFCATLAKRAT